MTLISLNTIHDELKEDLINEVVKYFNEQGINTTTISKPYNPFIIRYINYIKKTENIENHDTKKQIILLILADSINIKKRVKKLNKNYDIIITFEDKIMKDLFLTSQFNKQFFDLNRSILKYDKNIYYDIDETPTENKERIIKEINKIIK